MLILIGKSCSGKDSIRKILVDQYRYIPVVQYTTRDIRPGEVNGVDYNFISEEEFKKKICKGFFAEYNGFKVQSGDTWYYGTAAEDLKVDNAILITNPYGLKQLKCNQLKNCRVFYLFVKEETIRSRMRGINPEEDERRLESDRKDFENIGSLVDYTISNDTESLNYVANVIDKLYKTGISVK